MKLLKIELHNVFCYEKEKIKLSNQFSLIKGINGSGKSSIFESILYALYGYTIRWNRTTDQIIRKGCKEGKVVLKFKGDDKEIYRITRGRIGREKILVLEKRIKKWVSVESKTNTELENIIEGLVNIPFEVFRQSIMFGQDDTFRFINATDSERKKLIGDILLFGRIDNAYKRAKEKSKDIETEYNNVSAILEHMKEQLTGMDKDEIRTKLDDAMNKFDGLNEKLATIKDNYKRVLKEQSDFDKLFDEYKQTLADIKDIKNSINETESRSLENIDEDLKELYDEEKAFEEKRDECSLQLKKINTVIVQIEMKLEHANEIKGIMKSGKCPTCKRSFEKQSMTTINNTIKELTNDIDMAKRTLAKLSSEQDNIKDDLSILSERKNELLVEKESVSTIEKYKNDLEKKKRRIRDIIKKAFSKKISSDKVKSLFEKKQGEIEAEIELLGKKENELETTINKLSGNIETWTKLLKDISKKDEKEVEQHILKNKLDHYNRILDIFGRTGIRHKIAELVLPELERLTNDYLMYLDDSGINVEFSGTEITKTGIVKDKLSVIIERDGIKRKYESFSGGEKKRIMVASALALADIVSKQHDVNFLFVDELFGALDDDGKQKLSQLLVRLSKRFNSIFVITHDESIIANFDIVLDIIKENGISKIKAV